MIKAAGLVFIALFCTMCGSRVAILLKKRVGLLKKTLLFLHKVSEQIQFTLRPLEEIFSYLKEQESINELDFISICAQQLEKKEPFPQAFIQSVRHSRCALNHQDREIICQLADILGASDVDNQLNAIALVKNSIISQLENAQLGLEKRCGMYTSLGVLSGIALVIILI